MPMRQGIRNATIIYTGTYATTVMGTMKRLPEADHYYYATRHFPDLRVGVRDEMVAFTEKRLRMPPKKVTREPALLSKVDSMKHKRSLNKFSESVLAEIRHIEEYRKMMIRNRITRRSEDNMLLRVQDKEFKQKKEATERVHRRKSVELSATQNLNGLPKSQHDENTYQRNASNGMYPHPIDSVNAKLAPLRITVSPSLLHVLQYPETLDDLYESMIISLNIELANDEVVALYREICQ